MTTQRTLIRRTHLPFRVVELAFLLLPTLASSAYAQGDAETLSARFRRAANRVLPSVVAVRSLAGEDRAFERPTAGGQAGWLPDNRRLAFRGGGASGVIIDAERGLILTTEQALGGGARAVVIFTDGRQVEADRVTRDPRSELVLLGISAQSLRLKPAEWGAEPLPEMGDWVLAVGRPTARSHAISAGIVSGRGARTTPTGEADVLWTDAITGGTNSGGPLVDLEGRLLGICLSPADGSGASQRLGQAIPAEAARRFVTEMADSGQVRRGYLGLTVGLERIRPEEQEVTSGLVITAVVAGSAAEEAGFRVGDRLLAVDGNPVAEVENLSRAVEAAPVGKEFRLSLSRAGKPLMLAVRSRARPDGGGIASSRTTTPRGVAASRPNASSMPARETRIPARPAPEKRISADLPQDLSPIADSPSGAVSLPPDPDESQPKRRSRPTRSGAAGEARPTAEPGQSGQAGLPDDSQPLSIPIEEPKPNESVARTASPAPRTSPKASTTDVPAPKADASASPKPQAAPSAPPATKPDALPKPVEKPSANPAPATKPDASIPPKTGPSTPVDPKAKPDDKPPIKPDATPQPKPDDKPKPKAEEKPKPDDKPKPKAEEKPQPKPDDKPKPKPDDKAKPASGTAPSPGTKPETAPAPAPSSEPVDLKPFEPAIDPVPAPAPADLPEIEKPPNLALWLRARPARPIG